METSLKVVADFKLTTEYYRTDKEANPNDIRDLLRFTDLKDSMLNGHTNGKANLIYYTRSRLINATEFYDLDGGLVDIYGQTINFDAVKCLIVRNREEEHGRLLEVTFKNERYYIGPRGYRVAWEPDGPGVESIVSSASREEGRIAVTSNSDITYDIIIIGATAESSSSNG